MKRLFLSILTASFLYGCTVEDSSTSSGGSSPTVPTNTAWTGDLLTDAYVHSLAKMVTLHKGNKTDSLFQDSNPNNTIFLDNSSIIKIGKTRDSLTSGDIITYSPQNGFIVFDLKKHYGGTVTNIRTANLKVKLYQRAWYNNDLKFVVSVMDTTILAGTITARVSAVQASGGQSCGYLDELTIDVKGNFNSSGKLVIGIKAENPLQEFASVKYCRIEFDGDVRTTTTAQTTR